MIIFRIIEELVDCNSGTRHYGRIRDVEMLCAENGNKKNRKIRYYNLVDLESRK